MFITWWSDLGENSAIYLLPILLKNMFGTKKWVVSSFLCGQLSFYILSEVLDGILLFQVQEAVDEVKSTHSHWVTNIGFAVL